MHLATLRCFLPNLGKWGWAQGRGGQPVQTSPRANGTQRVHLAFNFCSKEKAQKLRQKNGKKYVRHLFYKVIHTYTLQRVTPPEGTRKPDGTISYYKGEEQSTLHSRSPREYLLKVPNPILQRHIIRHFAFFRQRPQPEQMHKWNTPILEG